jgi:hypothetical protein
VEFGKEAEGVKMGRWLRDIYLVLAGQGRNDLSGGNAGPSAVRKLCLLDESKRVFFAESVDGEKDSEKTPVKKPKPEETVHPH